MRSRQGSGQGGPEAALMSFSSALLTMKGHLVLSFRHGQIDILERSLCWIEMGIIDEIIIDCKEEIQVKIYESALGLKLGNC